MSILPDEEYKRQRREFDIYIHDYHITVSGFPIDNSMHLLATFGTSMQLEVTRGNFLQLKATFGNIFGNSDLVRIIMEVLKSPCEVSR